ncbi:hypothetical protein SAMD00019534_095040 [Acytostelium subglobosum LB1]|uniref:hypothetical protein n=1 Tax=Acytostelium subglobosum LB1 TaxID=1410327 RepID=UPI000644E1B7|nr:hypothetical protein SAMD00019534_095040 [Acytostelium subglobosum LB1]GAM26329.1 hypothetical protein SAMD00019534_095040 [Acytostelium subglobosum LB1]|eukprot:XP_012750883.1 hypothetical protein SAMD00019534_095040 [Acytostelium subglobosum LB1]
MAKQQQQNNNNKQFNIQLQDTNREADSDLDVVVKNTPFLIVLNVVAGADFSFDAKRFSKDDVNLQLVYDDNTGADSNQGVTYRKTKPLDYNVYLKDRSMTIETRLHVLSSKHENNCFRVSVEFNGHRLVTKSIKCVSKLVVESKKRTKKVQQPASSPLMVPNSPEMQDIVPAKTSNKRKSMETEPAVSETMSKSLKKLKSQQKKDRELITLLYKQNVMLLNQVNTLTKGLNTLITVHNDTSSSMPSSPCSLPMYSPSSPADSSVASDDIGIFPHVHTPSIESFSQDQCSFNYDDNNNMDETCQQQHNNINNTCLPVDSYQQQSQLVAIPTDFSLFNEQVMPASNYSAVTADDHSGYTETAYNTQQLNTYSPSSYLDVNLDFNSISGSCNATMFPNVMTELSRVNDLSVFQC